MIVSPVTLVLLESDYIVNVCMCNDLAQRCADVRQSVGPGD